jgi:dTDP-4-amino-4,6-dideoxygalactose transaminase
MEVIGQRVKQKRWINTWYRQLLSGVPEISFQTEPSEEYFSNYWLTTILIDPKARTTNESLRLALDEANIEARPLWKPMHLQPVFAAYPAYVNGQSEKLFNTGLCLPSCTNLTENDMDRITEVLTKVLIPATVS